MDIYALICTRSTDFKPITRRLSTYLCRAGVKVNVLAEQESIYSAYDNAIKTIQPKDNDIIIFCHDDIEIITDKEDFVATLEGGLKNEKTGFVGVAGTTNLGNDAIWWLLERRQKGLHRGFVFQGEDIHSCTPNYFGPQGRVTVLDGVFLAAKYRTIKKIKLTKPDHFPGLWDFYDINYTSETHLKGFINMTVPIILVHNSRGETRDDWEKNRKAFVEKTKLPLCL